MIYKILIQKGYLVLAGFIVMYIIFLRNKWISNHFLKSKVIFPPFKKWTWNRPPENYRSIFYVDVSFGILFLFMTLVTMSAPGIAIMLGYLSLIFWITAARLFYRVRKLERQQMN
jgi:hypothetical protein